MQTLRRFIIYAILILLNLRGFLNGLGIDVLWISLLFNCLIFFAINYRKTDKATLLLALFYLLNALIFNFSAIALFDIIVISKLISDIKIRQIALLNSVMIFIFLLSLYYMAENGYTNEEEWISAKGNATSLGLNNPNALGMWFFYLILNIGLFIKKKPTLTFYLIISYITYCAYTLSYSRTALIGSLLFIILSLLTNKWDIGSKAIFGNLPSILFIGILLTTFLIAALLPIIDTLFSFRFSNYLRILSSLSWINMLFGYTITEVKAMDNAFLMLWFEGGLIAIYLLIYHFKSISILKQKYSPFLISFLVAGVAENTFSVPSTTSMLFWSLILYNRRDCIRLKK